MILDNLSRALRTQNWLAAGIEFVIVIAGVVIGFQINAWNEARAEREAEARLLDRLYAQVAEVERTSAHARREAAETGEALYAARALMYRFGVRELSRAECFAVSVSHQPLVPPALPMVDELIATGQIGALSNETLQGELSTLASMLTRSAADTVALRAESYDLPVLFPDHIALTLERTDDPEDIDGFVPGAACDAGAMFSDQAFRNAFGQNVANYNGYLLARRGVERQLEAVRAALEAQRGGTRPEPAP